MIRSHALAYAYAGGGAPLRFPDVDLPQGGCLLLRGRSGAGKSTWLALAAGLRTAAGGVLEVAGQPLTGTGRLAGARRDAWRARTLGFLPQALHLSPALSVAENLALPFFAAGLPRDDRAIDAALGRLGIAALAARRPNQLSGGQAQRVALARAVLLSPRVLLADEPTASLDDDAARAALELLTACAAEGQATLVVATHDRRAADALAAHPGRMDLDLDLGLSGSMPPDPLNSLL
ncbi:ABC transporter ATP-binding protein [Paracidovorax konjaci]|uniref:Putative ABC transport system ATP-binding protein n=1 Tax=Paracidovorax konjaci TaxID=32040 RepID=A0A1I1WBU5_9BURK|nr:ATP-binding cassette domain-containing protein [Paracidovorax konjaci]SFD92675.1 putative ABC transport system ATP-binding protein [Paracidovorax konjaci]